MRAQRASSCALPGHLSLVLGRRQVHSLVASTAFAQVGAVSIGRLYAGMHAMWQLNGQKTSFTMK